jgi:hypothetical protein
VLSWRARAQLRRRARRRYLSVVHRRWLAAGAPRHSGRPDQVLVTVLWLAVPAVLAMLAAVAVWLLEAPANSPVSPDGRLLAVLLLVPILGVALLRRR